MKPTSCIVNTRPAGMVQYSWKLAWSCKNSVASSCWLCGSFNLIRFSVCVWFGTTWMNHPQLIPCAHPFICVYEQFQCLLIVCTSHVLIGHWVLVFLYFCCWCFPLISRPHDFYSKYCDNRWQREEQGCIFNVFLYNYQKKVVLLSHKDMFYLSLSTSRCWIFPVKSKPLWLLNLSTKQSSSVCILTSMSTQSLLEAFSRSLCPSYIQFLSQEKIIKRL